MGTINSWHVIGAGEDTSLTAIGDQQRPASRSVLPGDSARRTRSTANRVPHMGEPVNREIFG